MEYEIKNLLNAVRVTTTSEVFDVSRFTKVGLQVSGKLITSGNGVFTVTGTIDGVNFVGINTLVDNVTNTNVQQFTRVSSKTISANGSALLWIDAPVTAIKVTVTQTTDGEYSASVIGK